MQIVRAFPTIDSRIISLKLFVGPLSFSGFCNGLSIPNISSCSSSPVLDNLLKMLATSL